MSNEVQGSAAAAGAAVPGAAGEIGLAIVVPSCDAYSDLWPALVANLFERWPDCPFPVYLVSNRRAFSHPRVITLQVGEDQGWSANLKAALQQVPAERVLLLIDDLFPTRPISTAKLLSLIGAAGDFDYLRLNPLPPPRARTSRGVGLVPRGDVYRTSTVFSIWRRSVLGELLVPHESAWEFELNGSARSDRFERWYASAGWTIPYVNLVIKRKIDPLARLRLARRGIHLASPRQHLSPSETLQLRLREVRARVFQWVPWTLQRRLRGRYSGPKP